MTKITNSKVLILLIAAASVGSLGSISFSGTVDAQDAMMDNLNDDLRDVQTKAIPDWIDNNFKWYGEGKIGQEDLLNSLTYMLDNSIMHLSDKAAQEMKALKTENAELKKKTKLGADGIAGPNTAASPDDQGRIKSQFNWDEETEQESLNHLRKAYDLNPNFETKVVQFDKDHDKWIDVLSIDWGSSSSTQGDPDRPVIVGRIYNTESDDRPTEEVAFYYNKISFAHDTVDEILAKGGSTSAWEDGIDKLTSNHGDSTVDSVVDDLQGIVVLCSTAIDKEILKIEAEMSVLEEIRDRQSDDPAVRSGSTTQYGESDMEFLQRHADRIDGKIQSLQTGLSVLEDKLATVGDDAQLANLDLQSTLQKQQQLLQMMSNISKSLHDTGMTTIKNIG
jgi:hypothetical protein